MRALGRIAACPKMQSIFDLHDRVQQRLIDSDVEQLGAGSLIGFGAHDCSVRDGKARGAGGVVEIAGEYCLRRTYDDACGLQIHFDPVRAEVALGSRMRVWIQVDSVIRARLHARFAADTSVWMKIDDRVSTSVQRMGRTYLDTRRIVAVVAPHHTEMPTDIGKLALLDVFHPGLEHADRNVVLFLHATVQAWHPIQQF